MLIGIDIRSLSARKNSGVEEYIQNLLPHLFRLGKKDEFVLLYNSYSSEPPKEVLAWEKLRNVTLVKHRIPSKILNGLLWQMGLPLLDRWVGGVDVFFSPNITFSSISKRTPHVITFHDLSFELFPHFFNFYRRVWHYLVNPRKQARKAEKIITVSESTREDVRNLYRVSREKIFTIYPGLSSIFFESLTDKKSDKDKNLKKKKRYGLDINKPFILFLGTLEPRKNIVGIIKAFNEFKTKTGKTHQLVIAGPKGWLFSKIMETFSNSPFKEDIVFTGPIKSDDRPSIISQAEIFVFPSFLEGFGFPVLEALSCGVPTITSASSSLMEVFGEHTLPVNPHDIGEIAWAMERLTSDKVLKKSLINRGINFSRGFTWEKTAEKTLEILHQAKKKTKK